MVVGRWVGVSVVGGSVIGGFNKTPALVCKLAGRNYSLARNIFFVLLSMRFSGYFLLRNHDLIWMQ